MTTAEPRVLSCQQVRFVDQFAIDSLQIPGILLMENAGRGCVDWLCQLGIVGPVLVLCGPGNNGGDGLVIARHLRIRDVQVGVILLSDPEKLRGDAGINWRICHELDVPWVQVTADADPSAIATAAAQVLGGKPADWIVDAMLGTGARGALRQPYLSAVELTNELPGRRFAVDIPSGLDAEHGAVHSPVLRADATASFVAAKPGLVAASARPFVGELRVLDIGLPPVLVQRALQAFVAE